MAAGTEEYVSGWDNRGLGDAAGPPPGPADSKQEYVAAEADEGGDWRCQRCYWRRRYDWIWWRKRKKYAAMAAWQARAVATASSAQAMHFYRRASVSSGVTREEARPRTRRRYCRPRPRQRQCRNHHRRPIRMVGICHLLCHTQCHRAHPGADLYPFSRFCARALRAGEAFVVHPVRAARINVG